MSDDDPSDQRSKSSVETAPSERDTTTMPNRRRVLQLMSGASVAALAGCALLEDDEEPSERRDPDWCIEENDVEVPEPLRTAESIDGIERDLDDLSGRVDAAYQCHPQGYQLCANCRFFIPGKPAETGSGVGACAIVEGLVRSQDWCALYQETEDLDGFPSPDPLGEPGVTRPPRRR